MNFEQILWNKVFCMMFGLVVMEGMTLSGHLSNINDWIKVCEEDNLIKENWENKLVLLKLT